MHWMKKLLIAFVGVGLVILSGCVSVTTPPGGGVVPPSEEGPKPIQYGTLSGTVLDADRPQDLGRYGPGRDRQSLRDGIFRGQAPPGKYTLTISRSITRFTGPMWLWARGATTCR